MIDTEKYAWCLKTCKSDGTSYKGFKWPSDIGSIVKCDDWNATRPVCGGGLHGLLDGYGNFNLLSDDLNAIWQIVEVERNKCIEIDGKVKFPECKLIATGEMATIMTAMSDYQINLMINDVSNYRSKLAASGDESQLAASWDWSIVVSSGLNSIAKAGENGCIALAYYDNKSCRYRLKVGYVGEEDIKPNVFYRINDDYEFEEV